jgi:predicted small metal-binding protein
MDKEIYCRDIGLDCDLMVCGKTEEQVLTKAMDHLQTIHNIRGFSEDLYEKARAAIREGDCDYGDADAEEMTSEECSECYEKCFECTDECC